MELSSSTPVVLFLQGPPSGFWRQLAEAFEAKGAKTHRVNFSLGDQLYWLKTGAINFRKRLSDWPAFIEALIARENITDILYYADQLPYHRAAAKVAEKLGVKCHAVEFGYLRPDWITLELNGMGCHSHFPHTPEQIRAIAAKVEAPDLSVKFTHTFGQEAFNDVLYNLTAYFGRPFFPFYSSDKYYDPLLDYLSWLPRLVRRAKSLPQAFKKEGHPPFFLLALQLQCDYQIRANSPYTHLSEMLEQVLGSFAKNAPKETMMVIKQHPLDNGWERWERRVRKIAAAHGISDRIVFIDEGNIGVIIRLAQGVVMVNSTVGLHSLRAGKPTLALGTAIYDVPGLTHQAGIDAFWANPTPVDMSLLDDFVSALAATIQIKGDFYVDDGRQAGIEGITSRVAAGLVNQPDAFINPPPRRQYKFDAFIEQEMLPAFIPAVR